MADESIWEIIAKEREKAGGCLSILVVLVLVVLLLVGCCDDGCYTTVYCVHAWNGKTWSETVPGCTASCPAFYEETSRSTYCPND